MNFIYLDSMKNMTYNKYKTDIKSLKTLRQGSISEDFINTLTEKYKVIYKYYLNSGRRAFCTLRLYNHLYSFNKIHKNHYERG